MRTPCPFHLYRFPRVHPHIIAPGRERTSGTSNSKPQYLALPSARDSQERRNLPGKAAGGQGTVRPGAGESGRGGSPPEPRAAPAPCAAEWRRGCERFLEPALPSLFLPLLFAYLCWHLTCKAACEGAGAPRRERPRSRAERPGSGGCGGTAAQGGRPAGPSVSLLVRKHGEIHQSGPKDGVRVPRKGGGRPGIHRGSRRRTRSPDGTEPCQPCPPSSRPETSRFPHSFSPTYLHGSALTLLTTYRGWRGSPADPPGAPSPAVGRGALPRGALRAPPAPRAAAAPCPRAQTRDLHGDITGRLSCGSQQPSSRAAARSASGPLPRRLLAKVIAPCPPLFHARADPLLLRRDASPTPRRGGTCLSLCTSRANFAAEEGRPACSPLPVPRSQVAAPARPRGLGPAHRAPGAGRAPPAGGLSEERLHGTAARGTRVTGPGKALPGQGHHTAPSRLARPGSEPASPVRERGVQSPSTLQMIAAGPKPPAKGTSEKIL